MAAMLTTVDNPFDPFTQFQEWYAYDSKAGYNTLALLARIAKVSESLSDVEYDYAITSAMNEIVQENVSGMHRLVSKPDSLPSAS